MTGRFWKAGTDTDMDIAMFSCVNSDVAVSGSGGSGGASNTGGSSYVANQVRSRHMLTSYFGQHPNFKVNKHSFICCSFWDPQCWITFGCWCI